MSLFKKKIEERRWVSMLKDCINLGDITNTLMGFKKYYAITKKQDFYLYFLELCNAIFNKTNKTFEKTFNIVFSNGDEISMIYEMKKWIKLSQKEFFYVDFNVLDTTEKNTITEKVADNQKKFVTEIKDYVTKNAPQMIDFVYECNRFLQTIKL